MGLQDKGLRNEALRTALDEALGGRPARLEDLLCRLGGALSARPNLKLAAAFGAEVAERPGRQAQPLLARLAADDSAPDTDRVFLPIAAAHGIAARVRAGHEVASGWETLGVLAADERTPVRLGARDALTTLAVQEGGPETLLERAGRWAASDDREYAYGATAMVVEVFRDATVLATLHDHATLLDLLSTAIALVAEAPRAASRSDALRRLTLSLPATLTAVVRLPGGGQAWMEDECSRETDPTAREVLSEAIARLSAGNEPAPGWKIAALRQRLEGSAKPPRDPTRRRPGHGRGKATRRIR
jgi:hypothetical protein